MAWVNYPSPETLMPHRGRMRFIERVIHWDAESLMVAARPGRDHPFAAAEGVAAAVGLEYLAQAAAVMGGLEAHQRKEPPPPGFLIACPNLITHTDWLPFDVSLDIHISRIAHHGNHHRFEGQIRPSAGQQPWVEATFDIMLHPPDRGPKDE